MTSRIHIARGLCTHRMTCLQEIDQSGSQQKCTNTKIMLVLFSQIISLQSTMLEVCVQRISCLQEINQSINQSVNKSVQPLTITPCLYYSVSQSIVYSAIGVCTQDHMPTRDQ